VAVFSTTAGLQGFPCAPAIAGAASVSCMGTTGANALRGSVVTVVFAPGVTAVGSVTGPGGASGTGTLVATIAVPLLPPPPPILLPPLLVPPIPLVPGAGPFSAPPEVPAIPEADTLLLLIGGLVLVAARASRRRRR
jgi:hypothetical protein